MHISGVQVVLPDHRYTQAEITEAFSRLTNCDEELLRRFHRATGVEGRNLALTLPDYAKLDSFARANDAYVENALDLGEQALRGALRKADIRPEQVDHLLFCSTTGVATPSLDARLAQRVGLRPDVKRVPVFGLGCAAGAAGLSRLHDYLRGWPAHVAVLVCVELCSLTIQRDDTSIANLVASGLFGDGAAAAVGTGHGAGPEVVATRSMLYPDTEHLMGWEVGDHGFRIVLDADLSDFVEQVLAGDIKAFLADYGLTPDQVATWICHPGGPKVIEKIVQTLGLPARALDVTWRSLREHGNLSSISVLHVLQETRGRPGAPAVLLALGPGFSAELLLLHW
ncbi:type III polyketide synthase [Nonomuraea phyllanthi]|uniref:Type III polyketide synthase n=2 Tax=Nonomuraea phyllanthi TaxID=2219224 RepID=A0A5C4VLR6_9ACTN|nr:3-oxoacyl-[acyl-carrier-protein] synthase III C-terminal domain-containing protein [Nonomuraea phyllanthi]KAB8189359.1 type III polyketide synthase [Nonomuraea phyllanthi]QFY11726.1 type III polyketide synthase [Nonomuraea phyllanthi]